jgi:transposase-like protein
MPDRLGHYHRHRFPAAVIAHAVWPYHRAALSLRDVEELRYERGIQVTYETIRTWVAKFGAGYATQLCKRATQPGRTWHLAALQVARLRPAVPQCVQPVLQLFPLAPTPANGGGVPRR